MFKFCLIITVFALLIVFSPISASSFEIDKPEVAVNAVSEQAEAVPENKDPQLFTVAYNTEFTDIQTEPFTFYLEPVNEEPEVKTISWPVITPYDPNPLAAKAVDRSLSLFTDRLRERFSIWLSRSGKYLDLMKEILRSKNVPEEIVFLSLIESGFSPHAYSRARAVGPWQFMAATGKRYGLVIDWWRDERRDPVKSTSAAADYLTDLYGMFGSWKLAMAAYNAGEGKISRALTRSKSKDYWSLVKTRYIKSETKNYVPHFIAASMIAVNPEEFGFNDIEYHEPFEYDQVLIEKPLDLEIAAKCAETTVEVIKDLNPELRRWCTPLNVPVYMLRIPSGTKEAFLKNLAEVPEEERLTVDKYTVKKGDTISGIAKKTGVPVTAILVLNSINKNTSLKPGTQIALPPKNKFSLDRDDKFDGKKKIKRSKKSRTVNPEKKLDNKKVSVTS